MVTNLYKAAIADINQSRTDGYQKALEDLVGFLDRENLGVGDGEGWKIRQWAMARLDGPLPSQGISDSDEEVQEEQRARSSSPVMERNSSPEDTRVTEPNAESIHRSDSAPPVTAESSAVQADLNNMFRFASPHAYPSNNIADNSSFDISSAARRAFPAPRRPSHRTSSRNLHRSAAQNLQSLGNGAGQKRKMVQDFFNVDFNDRRDGAGGGPKRGRFT